MREHDGVGQNLTRDETDLCMEEAGHGDPQHGQITNDSDCLALPTLYQPPKWR